MDCDASVVSENSSPKQRSHRFSPLFYSIKFRLVCFAFGTVISINFSVNCKALLMSSFLLMYIQFSKHHLLKSYSFSIELSVHIFQNSDNCSPVVHFWAFQSVIYVSVLLFVPCCLYHCNFMFSLEIGQDESSNLVFLLQYEVDYSRSFPYHVKILIILLRSAQQLADIVIGIAFNL